MNVDIKIVDGGTVPSYGSDGAAALDVCARQSGMVLSGERKTIALGFCIQIPVGYVGLITGRSGLASKKGVDLFGGVIDSDYRGECHAILFNSDRYPLAYVAGDRIAQMLIVPCLRAELQLVEELTASERGTAGFGSSGK